MATKPRKATKKKVTKKSSAKRAAKKHVPFLPYGVLIFVLVVFFDQYTKHAISSGYVIGESHQIFSWLWYTYIQNTGMVWGNFQGANGILVWLSVIAFGVLLYFHDEFKTKIEKVCYALLIAGIWGNLLDRWLRGFVVDFIDLGWWPIFNIADSAICVGIAVFLLEQLRKGRSSKT